MITLDSGIGRLVFVSARWVWRNERRIARKLLGFAAAEMGSAIDMMDAAALTSDPKVRRLFFRHALDEHRHAALFLGAARRIDPQAVPPTRAIARAHNLCRELTPPDFLAFVHVAESEGRAQFLSLARHFRNDDRLGSLFTRIADEETFHATYSLALLQAWQRRGIIHSAARTVRRLRIKRVWQAWRRLGRRFGDAIARATLTCVYIAAAAPFAWIARCCELESRGWHRPESTPKTLAEMRRMY